MIQFASTDPGGCTLHNDKWSDDLVGICPSWDGRSLSLWVVGPSTCPELLDGKGAPLRPEAAAKATEEAAIWDGFLQCKGSNPIWILPLAEDLADEAWVPFKLRVGDDTFAGMARRPPAWQVSPAAPEQAKPKAGRPRGRPRTVGSYDDV